MFYSCAVGVSEGWLRGKEWGQKNSTRMFSIHTVDA